MISGTVFLIMITFSTILLLVATLSATIAISYISQSQYATDKVAQEARLYLVAASVIGWMTLLGLVLTLIFGAVIGGFRTTNYNEIFSKKVFLSDLDLKQIEKDKTQINIDQMMSLVILFLVSIVTVMTLIVGILCIVSSARLNAMFKDDANSTASYMWSISGAVTGFGGSLLMVISVILYAWYRNERKTQVNKLDETVKVVGTTINNPEAEKYKTEVINLIKDKSPADIDVETVRDKLSPYLDKIKDADIKYNYINSVIQPYIKNFSPEDAKKYGKWFRSIFY